MTRLLPRIKRIKLDGDYADVWIDVLANAPMGMFTDMASRDEVRMRHALARLVRGSNLEDENGEPIDLHTAEGWNEVPPDFWEMVGKRCEELFQIPKASSTESTTGSSGMTPPASLTTTPS